MADLDVFSYEKLESGEIRLLHLDGEVPSMIVYDLTERPVYNALSYCWGTEDASELFTCKTSRSSYPGKIRIRPNVRDALQQIQSVSTLPIWIDALCIDQDDEGDKAQQLPLMGQIYSEAAHVMVWLGREENESALAMAYIGYLTAQPRDRSRDGLSSSDLEWLQPMREATERRQEFRVTNEALQIVGLPPKDHKIWQAFGNLYSRAWLDRLWTYQEVMLSSTCSVLCGDAVVPWHSFFTVARWLASTQLLFHAYSLVSKSVEAHADDLPDINRMRSFANPVDRGVYFWLHLREGRFRQASLEADHIYALMSLAAPELRKQIPLHYAKGTQRENYWQLYIVTTRILLTSQNPFNTFQEATSASKHPRLPSWCPDYSQPPDTVNFCSHARAGLYRTAQIRMPEKLLMVAMVGGNTIDVVEKTYAGYIWQWPRERTSSIRGHGGSAEKMHHWLVECENLAGVTFDGNMSKARKSLFRVLLGDIQHLNQDEFPRDYHDQIPLLQQRLEELSQMKAGTLSEHDALNDDDWGQLQPLFTWMARIWRNRVMFRTKAGRLGFAHRTARAGDEVCVFYGSSHCHVLRRHEAGTRLAQFQYVSEAYVDGLMMGEAEALLGSREPEIFDMM